MFISSTSSELTGPKRVGIISSFYLNAIRPPGRKWLYSFHKCHSELRHRELRRWNRYNKVKIKFSVERRRESVQHTKVTRRVPLLMKIMSLLLAQCPDWYSRGSHKILSEEQPNGAVALNIDESLMPMPMNFGRHGSGGQCYTGSGHGGCPDIPGQAIMDVDMNQFWTTVDWNWMYTQGF
jgi:hypothetical protein